MNKTPYIHPRYLLLLIPLLWGVRSMGQDDLFFSEYVEGTGNNKCIEIFNPTENNITLTGNYRLRIFENGGTSGRILRHLEGVIPPKETHVVCAIGLCAISDQCMGPAFNGNDAVALEKDGDYIDVFGAIGCNPGDAGWTVDGQKTKDVTLRRTPCVISGSFSSGGCSFPGKSTWEAFPVNTFNGLGIHKAGTAQVEIVGNDALCDNLSITLVATPDDLSNYKWSTGSTASSIVVTSPGIYGVTVTSPEGCKANDTKRVNGKSPAITSTVSRIKDVSCRPKKDGGFTIKPEGGSGGFTFKWEDGSSESGTITGLGAGTYQITVTDNNGCTVTNEAEIGGPITVPMTPKVTGETCIGRQDGTITLNTASGSGLQYSIDGINFQSSNRFTDLPPGNYSAEVINSEGCGDSKRLSVSAGTRFNLRKSLITEEDCEGTGSGQIILIPEGGLAPYQVSFNGAPFVGKLTFSNLKSDTFDIIIRDASGCEKDFQQEIKQGSEMVVGYEITPATCIGVNDGAISIKTENTSGSPGYFFIEEDGGFSIPYFKPDFTDLSAGKYKMLVRDYIEDEFDCRIPINFEIIEKDPLITEIINPISCDENALSSITVLPQNGTVPYQYKLDKGDYGDDNVFSDLVIQDYVVTTQDSIGCTKIDSVNFAMANNFEIVFVIPQAESCPEYEDGVIRIATNSSDSVFYSLDGINYGGINILAGLAPNDYTVYAKAGDCIDSTMTRIEAAIPITIADIIPQIALCEGEPDGQLTIMVAGGKTPYVYQLDDGGFQSSNTFTDLVQDTYTLTVRDSNQCEQIFTDIILAGPVRLDAECETIQNVTTKGGTDGLAEVTIFGGASPYNVQLQDVAANSFLSVDGMESFTNLAEGDYTILISDKNGCTTTCDFTIDEPQCDFSLVPNPTNVTCFEGQNGAIALDLPAENEPYTIEWSDTLYNGQSNITGLTAGIYKVTVSSELGCLDSSEVTLTEPAALQVEIVANNTTICEKDSIQLTLSDTFSEYLWSNNATTATTIINEKGNYQVTVKDELGCAATDEITIDIITQDTLFDTQFTCDENSVGTFSIEERGSDGCMDMVFRTFQLVRKDTIEMERTTCNPSEVGVFSAMFSNAFGCDSLVFTTVNLLRSDTIYQTALSCNSDEVGIRNEKLTNAVGCDSILVIETMLDATVDQTFLTDFTCNPDEIRQDTTVLKTFAGCDSLLITDFQILRRDTIYQTEFSCNSDELGISNQILINAVGCDSILVIETMLDATVEQTFTTAFTCNPIEVGIDTTVLKTIAGCDSLIITEAISNTSEPTRLTAIACDESNVRVDTFFLSNQFLCDSMVIIGTTLAPSQAISLDEQSCNPQDTGMHTQYLVNQFGCDSIVAIQTSLTPINECSLSFAAKADTICRNEIHGTIQVSILEGQAPFDYFILNDFWRDTVQSGMILEEETVIENVPVGQYTLVVVNSQNIKREERIAVWQAAAMEINGLFSDYNGFAISCEGEQDGSIQLQIDGGKGPYTYQWETGEQTEMLQNLPIGNYKVTVTDANNCFNSATFELSNEAELSVDYQSFNASCLDKSVGRITIFDLPNVNGSAEYSLDGTFFQPIDDLPFTIENITPGDYELFVQDENDCQASTTFNVAEALENTLTLGNEKNLILGDTLSILPKGNFEIDRYEWSADLPLACNDCAELKVMPNRSSRITLTAYDINGCSATASVNVYLRKESRVYLPNIFSPNGDGLNDVYQIFTGKSVIGLNRFRIFDYEGRLMYEINNRPANDPIVGWDGMFNGQKMLPAVFVVFAEVELLDGTTREYSQTMTLVE